MSKQNIPPFFPPTRQWVTVGLYTLEAVAGVVKVNARVGITGLAGVGGYTPLRKGKILAVKIELHIAGLGDHGFLLNGTLEGTPPEIFVLSDDTNTLYEFAEGTEPKYNPGALINFSASGFSITEFVLPDGAGMGRMQIYIEE